VQIDVGRFIRLRSTVKAASTSIPKGQEAAAGAAFADAYRGLRAQVFETLPEPLRDEFTRLFPDSVPPQPSGDVRGGGPLLAQAAQANAGRSLLEQMAGWLDGVVESAEHEMRLEAEARAYAEERVKAERGVGFRPGD
jgi:hypothetical protein